MRIPAATSEFIVLIRESAYLRPLPGGAAGTGRIPTQQGPSARDTPHRGVSARRFECYHAHVEEYSTPASQESRVGSPTVRTRAASAIRDDPGSLRFGGGGVPSPLAIRKEDDR